MRRGVCGVRRGVWGEEEVWGEEVCGEERCE